MKRERLLILGLTLAVLLHMLFFALFANNEDLIDKPLGEDAYYMFSIARNIARGEGITYNHHILTNGIQPLVVLPYTLIYYFVDLFNSSEWLPLRLIIIVNLIFLVLTGIYARLLVKRFLERLGYSQTIIATAQDLVLLLIIVNINIMRHYTYGLETGLYLLLIIVWLSELVRFKTLSEVPLNRTLGLGILAGLTILARIDFVIISGVFLLVSLLVDRGRSLKQIVVIVILASIIASPWFVYNYANFGSFLPSSGTAQSFQEFNFNNVIGSATGALQVIADQIIAIFWLPTGFLGSAETLIALGKLAAIVAIFIIIGRPLLALIRRPIYAYILGCLLLVVAYVLLISAGHFYPRYFSPLLIIWLLLLSMGLAIKLNQPPLVRFKRYAHFLIPISVFVIYGVFALYTLHRGAVSNSHIYTVWWLEENIDPTTPVGAFQSGVIGYFHENVYNLDGKVNPQALQHWLDGTLGCYVVENEMEYVVDWDGYLNRLGGDFIEAHTHEVTMIPGGSSIVLQVDLEHPPAECSTSEENK